MTKSFKFNSERRFVKLYENYSYLISKFMLQSMEDLWPINVSSSCCSTLDALWMAAPNLSCGMSILEIDFGVKCNWLYLHNASVLLPSSLRKQTCRHDQHQRLDRCPLWFCRDIYFAYGSSSCSLFYHSYWDFPLISFPFFGWIWNNVPFCFTDEIFHRFLLVVLLRLNYLAQYPIFHSPYYEVYK